MTKQSSLLIVLVISIIGVLFSGFLSYQELFVGMCRLNWVTCKGTISLGGSLPACVYGLIMYFLLVVVSLLGLLARKTR